MINQLTFGSLFAGIGGFDLGFERVGMKCLWQVEKDKFCQKVLAKHWPNVERFGDIRDVGKHNLQTVDVVCGGFPCQPHSTAGKRQASRDERDLWGEFYRIISEVKPRWIVAENVPGLLSSENRRYFGKILYGLAQIGYDAEWCNIPASGVGLPHLRKRFFIVAYPNSQHVDRYEIFDRTSTEALAKEPKQRLSNWVSRWITDGQGHRRVRRIPDPGICRAYDGVPGRLDRYKGLGNAVVPQVAEYIGRLIVEAHSKQVTQHT